MYVSVITEIVNLSLYFLCIYLFQSNNRNVTSRSSWEQWEYSRTSGGIWRNVKGAYLLQRTLRYTAFGMWWHTVTHGWGSEGETGEWSG